MSVFSRFALNALAFCLMIGFFFTSSLRSIAKEKPFVYREPDHLVPVDPYPGDWHVRYLEQIRGRFSLNSYFFFQMLVLPSFSAEYVVRLHSSNEDRNIKDAEKCFLTYSIADKSIWYSMPENNDQKTQKEVKIKVATVEFPKPLACRLERLWSRMLLRLHYPEMPNGGLDGTTYEFGMWCMYGETWTPQERKSPLLFVQLGESLVNYCKALPADRQDALKSIEQKAEKLSKYLDAH